MNNYLDSACKDCGEKHTGECLKFENTQEWESPISSGVVYWRLVMEKTKEKWPTDEQFAEGTVRELIDCAFEVTQDLLTKRTEEVSSLIESFRKSEECALLEEFGYHGKDCWDNCLSNAVGNGVVNGLLEEIKERYGK